MRAARCKHKDDRRGADAQLRREAGEAAPQALPRRSLLRSRGDPEIREGGIQSGGRLPSITRRDALVRHRGAERLLLLTHDGGELVVAAIIEHPIELIAIIRHHADRVESDVVDFPFAVRALK